MRNNTRKNWAPVCTMPDCTNRVGYHKRYPKEDGTPGFKWMSACDYHRTTGKVAFNEWKISAGCENADGHYGFPCPSRWSKLTPSMIDINHIDGDRKNSDPSNLERLCRCCHGEVTILQGHHKNRYTNIPRTFSDLFNQI